MINVLNENKQGGKIIIIIINRHIFENCNFFFFIDDASPRWEPSKWGRRLQRGGQPCRARLYRRESRIHRKTGCRFGHS